jgi:hypothetical protein
MNNVTRYVFRTTFRCGGKLSIYWLQSRGQPKRGSSSTWLLGRRGRQSLIVIIQHVSKHRSRYWTDFMNHLSNGSKHKDLEFQMARPLQVPIIAAARSKVWTVFAHSDAVIVGWNPTQGMDIWCVCMRLFCVCVVLCLGSGLVTGWSLVQGVLPSVKNDSGTKYEAWALNGLKSPWKKKGLYRWCLECGIELARSPIRATKALHRKQARPCSNYLTKL